MVIKKPKILGCFNVSFIFQLTRFQTFSFFSSLFLGSCRNRIELMSILLFTTIVPKLRYISYIIYNLPMLSVGREWEENLWRKICLYFWPMQVGFFERDCKNLAQTRDKCNHCLSNQRSVALSHLNKESMNQDSSCHPVKTLQCSTSALLDFFYPLLNHVRFLLHF